MGEEEEMGLEEDIGDSVVIRVVGYKGPIQSVKN